MRLSYVGVLCASLMACGGGHSNVQCEQNSNCNLSGGGMCLTASTGNQWCAYPDPECPGGYRYSNDDVGDGLSGVCVPTSGSDAGIDAGIDGAMPDAPPAHFVVTFGGANLESITDMHGVSDGVIIAGTVQSSCMLGSAQLSPGYVVAKLDASGGVVWTRPQGYTDNLQLAGTGTTSNGDVIVAGAFVGAVNFGGTTLHSNATNWDVFIAKYSGVDGSHLWSVPYGGAGPEHVSSVVVDQAGDVYVSGYWNGTGNFGGADTVSAGGDDFFVAKYSGSNGTYLWGLHGGSTGNDYVPGITVDSSGLYACGTFAQTINLGGSNLVSAGANDIFLASFNATNGNHRWSERFGSTVTTSNDSCTNLIASGGSVYMAGSFASPLGVGGTTLTTQGSSDVYVGKYDNATGSHVWSHSYGGAGLDSPASQLAVGSNLLVTGRFQQTINYSGGGSVSSAGGDDAFVQTVTQSDGTYVDAFRTGGASNDVGTALTTLNGALVVGGAFQGVSYFGTTQATSNGMQDAFVYEP